METWDVMDVGVGNGKASVECYNFKLDANLQESGALYYKLVLQRKDCTASSKPCAQNLEDVWLFWSIAVDVEL